MPDFVNKRHTNETKNVIKLSGYLIFNHTSYGQVTGMTLGQRIKFDKK